MAMLSLPIDQRKRTQCDPGPSIMKKGASILHTRSTTFNENHEPSLIDYIDADRARHGDYDPLADSWVNNWLTVDQEMRFPNTCLENRVLFPWAYKGLTHGKVMCDGDCGCALVPVCSPQRSGKLRWVEWEWGDVLPVRPKSTVLHYTTPDGVRAHEEETHTYYCYQCVPETVVGQLVPFTQQQGAPDTDDEPTNQSDATPVARQLSKTSGAARKRRKRAQQ
jgi:hypothetical protein